MDKLKKNFASKLLKIKAIKLQPNNPFTWASGWKSPFYCDNRKTLSYPDLRNYVKFEIVHTILEEFPEVEAIAGVATGAIPQGALVADALHLPFVYVRSKPKAHGLENLIEGELRPGMNVLGLLSKWVKISLANIKKASVLYCNRRWGYQAGIQRAIATNILAVTPPI